LLCPCLTPNVIRAREALAVSIRGVDSFAVQRRCTSAGAAPVALREALWQSLARWQKMLRQRGRAGAHASLCIWIHIFCQIIGLSGMSEGFPQPCKQNVGINPRERLARLPHARCDGRGAFRLPDLFIFLPGRSEDKSLAAGRVAEARAAATAASKVQRPFLFRVVRQVVGLCRHSGIGIGEAATGCFADIRTSTGPNVRFHCKQTRNFDPISAVRSIARSAAA
jgi:hypothetical protein